MATTPAEVLAACMDNPNDEAFWNAYADCLRDNGQGDEADRVLAYRKIKGIGEPKYKENEKRGIFTKIKRWATSSFARSTYYTWNATEDVRANNLIYQVCPVSFVFRKLCWVEYSEKYFVIIGTTDRDCYNYMAGSLWHPELSIHRGLHTTEPHRLKKWHYWCGTYDYVKYASHYEQDSLELLALSAREDHSRPYRDTVVPPGWPFPDIDYRALNTVTARMKVLGEI